LDRKLANIDEKISAFLKSMDKTDKDEKDESLTPEQVKAALDDLATRKEKYEGYLEYLKESGETQILETDPEARRMHSRNGFHCSYNVQTAVDSGSHLITEYEVTNHNTDQGLLHKVGKMAKKILSVETIEVVGDKGYESRADIFNCLYNGIVPNVAFKYDKTERIYNIDYEEAEITEEIKQSTKPEDIQKCLHAGVMPKCYENTIINVELQEKSTIGCFTRNDDNTVTCPMGQRLTKIRLKGVNTEYASKEVCRQCPNRCIATASHKKVSFGPNTKHIAVWMYGNIRYEVIRPPKSHVYHNAFFRKDISPPKKVVIYLNADIEKQKQRMCHSEHPFGTVKWYGGAHYLLCRGKKKVTGEVGLSFLAYNIRRAITLVGAPALIAAAKG
jgi:transposase